MTSRSDRGHLSIEKVIILPISTSLGARDIIAMAQLEREKINNKLISEGLGVVFPPQHQHDIDGALAFLIYNNRYDERDLRIDLLNPAGYPLHMRVSFVGIYAADVVEFLGRYGPAQRHQGPMPRGITEETQIAWHILRLFEADFDPLDIEVGVSVNSPTTFHDALARLEAFDKACPPRPPVTM